MENHPPVYTVIMDKEKYEAMITATADLANKYLRDSHSTKNNDASTKENLSRRTVSEKVRHRKSADGSHQRGPDQRVEH